MGNHSPGKIIKRGKRAQMEGNSLNDNPYKILLSNPDQTRIAADYWKEGWKEAEKEEEENHKRETEKANRSVYEIPLSEFGTLGDLIDAIEEHKKDD